MQSNFVSNLRKLKKEPQLLVKHIDRLKNKSINMPKKGSFPAEDMHYIKLQIKFLLQKHRNQCVVETLVEFSPQNSSLHTSNEIITQNEVPVEGD